MKRSTPLLLAALGLGACAGILGYKKKSGPHPFEHRGHVLKGITCLQCHAGVQKAGDTGPVHIPGTADCMTCHKKPHDRRACDTCHGMPLARIGATSARKHLRFSHQKHLPRAKGNCMRCHQGVSTDAGQLRPPMATCFSCHEHAGQFEVRKCDACHVDLPAERTRPSTHVVHGDDFVREHGVRAASSADLCATCHKQSFCLGCHGQTTAALPARLSFHRTLSASIHRAGFRSRHALEARSDPGLCVTCHRQDFCGGCHTSKNLSAATGRSPHRPGWVGPPGQRNDHGPAARRNPTECASCHGGAGEALCVGCHKVGGVGGNPHPPGWSSRAPKTSLPCRLCHPGAR